jgi:hypothetical protein
MTTKSIAVIATLAVAAAISASTALAGTDSLRSARAGTATFHNLDTARANDYVEFHDAADIACIDNPGTGAMGIHYVNLGVVGDPSVDPATPEALVYEPTSNGRLRLVAVEYIVDQAAWDATHTSAPELFGQEFELLGSPNRYGLPPFYELHAWIWKHNPRGMFDDWNPRVSCDAADAIATASSKRIEWTPGQLQSLADAYRAKNPGWRAPTAADVMAAADVTWTSENLDRLAAAYAALNPGWTRP